MDRTKLSKLISLVWVVSSGLEASATAAPEAARVLTFREVLEAVREKNPLLDAARADAEVARGEVRRSWSLLKPVVNAAGSLTLNSVESKFDSAMIVTDIVTRVSDALDVSVPPEALAGLPPPSVIAPHVQLAGAVNVNQVIFSLEALRAPGVAEATQRAALARIDAVEDQLLFSAATLYATLGGLKALEAASARAIAVAEQRVKDARVQLEAGTATQLVLTRAETDRVVAEGQKSSVRAKRRGVLANLRALIGSNEEIDVDARRLDEYVHVENEDSERRASVVAKARELEAAERAVGLTELPWLPKLTADGQVRYTNFEGFSGERLLATAAINLLVPIYDGGVRYANQDIAEARVLAASRALENERLQARAFLEEARATLDAARAELAQAEAERKLAEEAVKQAEDLVAHGLATGLELTDADARRFTSDRTVVQKELDLDLAVLRIAYASGGKLLER